MQNNPISQNNLPGLPLGVHSELHKLIETQTSPGRAVFESFLEDRLFLDQGKHFIKELERVISGYRSIEGGWYAEGIDGADRTGRLAKFKEAKKELGEAVQSALDSLKPVLPPLLGDGYASTNNINSVAYRFVTYQQANLLSIQKALSR